MSDLRLYAGLFLGGAAFGLILVWVIWLVQTFKEERDGA